MFDIQSTVIFEDWSQHKNKRKSQDWTGPGVQRSKRTLLASHTRYKMFYGNLRELGNMVKVGNKVQFD